MPKSLSNLIASQNFPFYVTFVLFIILFGAGSLAFEGFFFLPGIFKSVYR